MAHIIQIPYDPKEHMKEIPIRKYRNGDAESYQFLAQKLTEILTECPVGSFKSVRYEKRDGEDCFVIVCNNDYEYVQCIAGDSNFGALEDCIKMMGHHC